MENENLKARIAAIDSQIASEKSSMDTMNGMYLKRIQELEHVKSVIKHLPQEALAMDWSVSSYKPYGADAQLYFHGGDLEYATLFDLGFEFELKPRFNEYNQGFSRDGKLIINDPLNGELVIEVSVSNIAKPPSCKIIETKKRKTVTVFEAICEETGEKI